MSMYVLQVLTGKEQEIRRCLEEKGIEAYVPLEERVIRTGGKWLSRIYTLIPSYVFVSIGNIGVDYYRIRQVTGIIRFLELHAGAATDLTPAEEKFIRSICSGGRPAPISRVEIRDGRIVPLDGPLKIYGGAGYPIRYDKHRRLAKVFTLGSIQKEIYLSFDIVQTPETFRG